MPFGKTYVIIIAVEKYNESQDFPDVDYALKDANDLISAFQSLNYEEPIFLPNEKATRAAILAKLEKITTLATKNDRIIFYFAGHGFYENGENLLGSVDVIKTAKSTTSVQISAIMGLLNKSASRQKILFLDCCHSGFEPGDVTRDELDNFMADELLYQFKDEEFCIGFSSCKNNETSVSHAKLQNGVWSHFLIKALSGNEPKIYKDGILFSDKLQAYLKNETKGYVKLNTVKKLDQTPIKFGSETDKFIIADINSILDEKLKKLKIADLKFTQITFLDSEYDLIRNLPGFQKGYHKVPTNVYSGANNFTKDISKELIEDDIKSISELVKNKLKYKRKDFKADIDNGSGTITTLDFDYNIWIEQSENDASKYELKRSIENFSGSEILSNSEFNDIFSNHFSTLSFATNKSIDIAILIDLVEELDDEIISVKYDQTDLTKCEIIIGDLNYSVVVTENSIEIFTDFKTSPTSLVSAFKVVSKSLLNFPSLKLLE